MLKTVMLRKLWLQSDLTSMPAYRHACGSTGLADTGAHGMSRLHNHVTIRPLLPLTCDTTVPHNQQTRGAQDAVQSSGPKHAPDMRALPPVGPCDCRTACTMHARQQHRLAAIPWLTGNRVAHPKDRDPRRRRHCCCCSASAIPAAEVGVVLQQRAHVWPAAAAVCQAGCHKGHLLGCQPGAWRAVLPVGVGGVGDVVGQVVRHLCRRTHAEGDVWRDV